MKTKKSVILLLLFYLIIVVSIFATYLYKTRDRVEYCTNDVCQEEEYINYSTTKLDHYQGIELITLQYDQNTTDWLFDKVKNINEAYLIDLKQIIFINETVIEYTNGKRYLVGGYYQSEQDHIVVYVGEEDNPKDVEKTLCHEIAHNILGKQSADPIIHSMVHFLGQEKFCYKTAVNVERGF